MFRMRKLFGENSYSYKLKLNCSAGYH